MKGEKGRLDGRYKCRFCHEQFTNYQEWWQHIQQENRDRGIKKPSIMFNKVIKCMNEATSRLIDKALLYIFVATVILAFFFYYGIAKLHSVDPQWVSMLPQYNSTTIAGNINRPISFGIIIIPIAIVLFFVWRQLFLKAPRVIK